MAKTVKVSFYGALARITKEKTIDVEPSILEEVMNSLAARYGEQFSRRIYDERGKLRRFINIYVNGKDIRFLGNLKTKLNEGDQVSIIPAVGGG